MNVPQLKLALSRIFASPEERLANVAMVIPSTKIYFIVTNSDDDHIATLNVRQVYWLYYHYVNNIASFWKDPVYPIPEDTTEFEYDQQAENIYFYNYLAGSKPPQ